MAILSPGDRVFHALSVNEIGTVGLTMQRAEKSDTYPAVSACGARNAGLYQAFSAWAV